MQAPLLLPLRDLKLVTTPRSRRARMWPASPRGGTDRLARGNGTRGNPPSSFALRTACIDALAWIATRPPLTIGTMRAVAWENLQVSTPLSVPVSG